MNYDNTNSGILTANKTRRNDKDPSHQGSINVDGREYWLSAWVNTGKDGGKLAGQRYFSIKLKPKQVVSDSGYDFKAAEKAAEERQQSKPERTVTEDFDDAIPFAWIAAIPLITFLVGVGGSYAA